MAISESDAAGPPVELNSQSLDFVERLFADYAADPASVPGDWRQFFSALANGQKPAAATAQPPTPGSLRTPKQRPVAGGV